MILSNLSKTKKFFLIFIILYLFLTLIYLGTLSFVDQRLEERTFPNIYNNCNKIWATRGLVTDGYLEPASKGNTVESLLLAFKHNAKGSEIDVFFDPSLNKYIVSHDYPYNLKNGKLLSLEELITKIGTDNFIWLDLKKLGKLSNSQVKMAVARLDQISNLNSFKEKLYIEGEDPVNLGYFRDSGFNTIFDTQPLPQSYFISTFVLNFYKIAYYFGDFTVMSMNSGNIDNPIFSSKAEKLLTNIPMFLYHVPDDKTLLSRLSNIENVKVVLNTDHSANRFNINNCKKESD